MAGRRLDPPRGLSGEVTYAIATLKVLRDGEWHSGDEIQREARSIVSCRRNKWTGFETKGRTHLARLGYVVKKPGGARTSLWKLTASGRRLCRQMLAMRGVGGGQKKIRLLYSVIKDGHRSESSGAEGLEKFRRRRNTTQVVGHYSGGRKKIARRRHGGAASSDTAEQDRRIARFVRQFARELRRMS